MSKTVVTNYHCFQKRRYTIILDYSWLGIIQASPICMSAKKSLTRSHYSVVPWQCVQCVIRRKRTNNHIHVVDKIKNTGVLALQQLFRNLIMHIFAVLYIEIIVCYVYVQVLDNYFKATKPADSSWCKIVLNHIWKVDRDGEVNDFVLI